MPYRPDFILIAQWDGYSPGFVLSFKGIYNNVPVVYWAFDHQADGQGWHERLVKQSDLYLSKRIADVKYPNWRWLSQDFSPGFLDRDAARQQREEFSYDKKDIDILFTGTYLSYATERNEILKAVDDKFNLVIHSVNPQDWLAQGFKNVNGPVMDEGLPALIARAKINISIDHTIEAGYWSDRNAQIMACGGLVLFRYVPLSESVFHDSVLYFYDKESCLTMIENLLDKPGEDLDMIREQGYGLAHHTMMVNDRVTDLLTIVRSIL